METLKGANILGSAKKPCTLPPSPAFLEPLSAFQSSLAPALRKSSLVKNQAQEVQRVEDTSLQEKVVNLALAAMSCFPWLA